MNNKTGSATPRLIAVSFALFAGFALSARSVIAQSGSTGVASTSQNSCRCWIDVKTGKRVGSVPTIPKAPGFAELSADGKTAFDPITKRNFALEPGGCWIDVKTGKRVGSVPTIPKAPGVAELSADGKTAFDPITKRNFALVPCPPRGETTGDTLKKVFESVHIGIGIGGDQKRTGDQKKP
jgi:hypothetical protein